MATRITIPSGATITNKVRQQVSVQQVQLLGIQQLRHAAFTAVAGVGYFVNTTGGAITVTLPAGPSWSSVAVKDYANTFDTNNVTLARNGSIKLVVKLLDATLSTEGISSYISLCRFNTRLVSNRFRFTIRAPTAHICSATGGTITTCGDFKIHTFTGPGTFTVSLSGNAAGSNTVDYLVVAGGGGGGGTMWWWWWSWWFRESQVQLVYTAVL